METKTELTLDGRDAALYIGWKIRANQNEC